MKDQDVLPFLKSKYTVIEQEDNGLSCFLPYEHSSIHRIEFIHRFCKVNKSNFKRLRYDLKKLIESDNSHSICGGYTYNNFYERPEDSSLFIYQSHPISPFLSAVIYFREDQMNLCGNNNLNKEILDLLLAIINLREKIFIFTSGKNLCSFMKQHFDYERVLSNNVYSLNEDLKVPNEKEVDIDVELIEYSYKTYSETSETLTSEQLSNLKLLDNFYTYEQTVDQILKMVRSKVHFLMYATNKKQAVAGVRANTTSPELSIIGGVLTIPSYRKKGIASSLCDKLTQFLVHESKAVYLETDVENFPAQMIYGKLGFRKCGESAFLEKKSNIISEIIGTRDY